MGVHEAFLGVVCVNSILQHMTHFITQTHHSNPHRDVPKEICVLRNKSLSRERTQPTFFVFSCKHGRRRRSRARRDAIPADVFPSLCEGDRELGSESLEDSSRELCLYSVFDNGGGMCRAGFCMHIALLVTTVVFKLRLKPHPDFHQS